jgi:uncharacterized protein YkwD
MKRKGSLVLLVFSVIIIYLLIINIEFDNNTEEEVIYTETVEKIEYAENYDNKSDILVYENEMTAIEVLNETNKYRSGKPLVLDTELTKVANIRAMELANTKELSHIRPNGRYYSELFEQYKIDATFSGENIAQGYTSAKEVCEAWKNSKGHYLNMIKDKYTKMGVGFYTKNGITYWVQIFSD